MRNVCVEILSAFDSSSTFGEKIDANQLVTGSFQFYFGDANAAGTCKIQSSNDPCNYGNVAANFTPTNWIDIPNITADTTSGAAKLLKIDTMNFRWVRAVYLSTAAGVQTIAPIADTGLKQTQTLTAVADVAGSLNSTYFLCSSVNLSTKAQKNFYVWLDNGSGVDPLIPDRTAVPVIYANDDTANTLGGLVRAALAALTNDFTITGANASIVITSKAFGPVTAAVDGSAATGFTFGAATLGIASNLNNSYFLIGDGNSDNLYYAWMNVDAIGTDPSIAGRTGAAIAFASGATAAAIGTVIASVLDALDSGGSFNTSGTTTVTVTNDATGPFVRAEDGEAPADTGFAFAVTGGGTSSVVCNMNAMSV